MKSVIFLVGCLFFPSFEASGIAGWSDADVATTRVKVEAIYKYYDVNNDGNLTIADLQNVVNSLATANHYSDDKKAVIKAFVTRLWTNVFGVTTETPMTKEQFVAKFFTLIGNGHMTSTEIQYRDEIFDIIDKNKNDLIHLDEFLEFAHSLGYTNDTKQTAAFNAIDESGDGDLTSCEYVTAYVEFLTDPTTTYSELPLF